MNFSRFKLYAVFFFFIFTINYSYSNIFSDLTDDYSIEFNFYLKDNSSDESAKKNDDLTDDSYFGNKWYSKQNIFIFSNFESGMSGTKDFLADSALFKYRFKSKNRHAFALRLYHSGFASGMYSGNFNSYSFCILTGFEYLYKIFGGTSGFFVWFDTGYSNKGFSFDTGLGIGDRMKDGIEISFNYLHNNLIFSRLDFYFLAVKVLTLRGKIGIDYKYTVLAPEMFTFLGGFYLGFNVKNVFRMEFGGGITLNDYTMLSGYGGINILLSIL